MMVKMVIMVTMVMITAHRLIHTMVGICDGGDDEEG